MSEILGIRPQRLRHRTGKAGIGETDSRGMSRCGIDVGIESITELRYLKSTWFRFSSPDGRFGAPLSDVSDIEQELARQLALQLNVQLLIYPGLPAPGFMYSIVPPLASVGSVFGSVRSERGKPVVQKQRGNPARGDLRESSE